MDKKELSEKHQHALGLNNININNDTEGNITVMMGLSVWASRPCSATSIARYRAAILRTAGGNGLQ